jgi:hypothetical protein
MRATRPGNWRSIRDSFPWSHRKARVSSRGNTIVKCTSAVTEVERLFKRLKGFRRIFSRFDKLDIMFVAFINFALVVDGLG